MTKQQILKQAKATISAKKQKAESIAQAHYAFALLDSAFKTNETNIANLTIAIAKKELAGEDTSAEQELMQVLEKEKVSILKRLSLSPSDLQPNYSCKKCEDKGLINGKYCKCLEKEVNALLMQDVGYTVDPTHTFENCDQEYLKANNLDKIYTALKTWVGKYPTSKYKNFTLIGKPGRGKTYLTDCIANALISKQEVVNFVTAFNLNNSMLNYHTTFDSQKNSILEPFLTCSCLIIDDLGTEPILKNVTKEYLYLIINERMVNDKSTIISTNLTPDQIIDRYGERIFSRLFNKTNCLKLEFTSSDLRLK